MQVIDRKYLKGVTGGSARVASSNSNDTNQQLQLMLTQISESIKDVAKSNQGDSSSMMMPMMMMMMMGGGGGGGGAAAAAAPPPPPPPSGTFVKVNVR